MLVCPVIYGLVHLVESKVVAVKAYEDRKLVNTKAEILFADCGITSRVHSDILKHLPYSRDVSSRLGARE